MLRECPLRDRKRFLLGCILPDAFDGLDQRALTHFTNRSIPGYMFFDFDAFRERFGAKMAEDELYLGYYMHLVEDNFYRVFFRERVGVAIDNQKPEQVRRLHLDYTLLNAYLVSHYGLYSEVERPTDFEAEPLNALARFDLDAFLAQFEGDFVRQVEGESCYLTETILEEFLAVYYEPCLRELRTVQRGERGLIARDMAWTKP